MKRTKEGISLITLVITIIIMIILAGAIIFTLTQSNIFDKANDAVNQSNLKEAQSLADVIWSEAYLDDKIITDEDYYQYVIEKLGDNGITTKNYYIEADKNGVTVSGPDNAKPTLTVVGNAETIGTGETITYVITFEDNKKLESVNLTEESITLNGFTATKAVTVEGNIATITLSNVQGETGSGKTISIAAGVAKDTSGNESAHITSKAFSLEKVELKLGNVITPLDYGKSINYETDNGASKWKVFYKTDKYVYIIADESIGVNTGHDRFKYGDNYTVAPVPETASNNAEETLKASLSGIQIPVQRTIINKVSLIKTPLNADETTAKPTISKVGATLKAALNVSEIKEKWMASLDSYTEDPAANTFADITPLLLNESYWTELLNTNKYKNKDGESYVLGAIGGPTLEIFAASWNEKRQATIDSGKEDIYKADIVLTKSENGLYYDLSCPNLSVDSLYTPVLPPEDVIAMIGGTHHTLIASHINNTSTGGFNLATGVAWSETGMLPNGFFKTSFIQPMVCLSADMPVEIDADGNYIIN